MNPTERITELRSWIPDAQTWLRALTELDATPELDTEIDATITEIEARREELTTLETREAKVAEATAQITERAAGVPSPPNFQKAPAETRDVTRMSEVEMRDQALRLLEEKSGLTTEQRDAYEAAFRSGPNPNQIGRGDNLARRAILTENPEYHGAFAKGVTGNAYMMTDDEKRALQDFRNYESRDMTEGTTTAGGFGVPILIDPSIILSAQVNRAPLLAISRIDTITTQALRLVSSAGSTWSFDTEGSAVSDDSPTLAQPIVTTSMARGFIPASIELIEDYPSFLSEVQMLLAGGYIDLVATKTAIGSGTNEPKGIFPAITASAGATLTTATTQVIVAADLTGLYGGVPERFRATASWFGHVNTESKTRLLGTATTAGSFTVDLAADGITRLMGKNFVVSDYAPQQPASTGAGGFLIVGDFSHFRIVQRAGMSIEYIPMLFDTTTNRPIGERGWFGWTRMGSDVDTTNAFRCLMNKTS